MITPKEKLFLRYLLYLYEVIYIHETLLCLIKISFYSNYFVFFVSYYSLGLFEELVISEMFLFRKPK